jgi:hypothetical protein
MTNAIEIGNVRCHPPRDSKVGPQRWTYEPLLPSPERGPSGKPTASLLTIGSGAILQLGAQLGLDGATESALAAEVQAVTRSTEPVVLSAKQLTISSVQLLLSTDTGQVIELAATKSSGYPPFTAIFTVALDDTLLAEVAKTFRGVGGLQVVYHLAADEAPQKQRLNFSFSQESSTVSIPGKPPATTSILRTNLTDQEMTLSESPAEQRKANVDGWFDPSRG